jgi:hypothetical protein
MSLTVVRKLASIKLVVLMGEADCESLDVGVQGRKPSRPSAGDQRCVGHGRGRNIFALSYHVSSGHLR